MMNKLLIIVFSTLIFLSGCKTVQNAENNFQNDADLLRLEHLLYWTALVEEYHKKKGFYPFQDTLNNTEEIGLVKIATKQQRKYLSPGHSTYNKYLDNNFNLSFKEKSIDNLVVELESVLGRSIEEKYDIQKVPTRSPVGYYYFYTNDGYLLWVTCITCNVTKISTLLLDGYTPTVNIVSPGMKGKVTKALLRKEMVKHPIFKRWIAKPYVKEEYVRNVAAEYIRDSKH